jgi:formylglycine-generating enzyme required for sulfatase activity
MSNIFISYSRRDETVVKALAEDIRALGHIVWFDQELSGGQVWWDRILSSVRDCDVFVFALAPGSLQSTACTREYSYAVALAKAILPVLVAEGVSTKLLPPALSRIHIADYRHQNRSSALALARAISAIPPSEQLPDPLPSPPEIPISYLGSLSERIETKNSLSYEMQSALVVDLRKGLRDPEVSDDAATLLEKLRKRPDLFATIADEIDDLLRSKRVASSGTLSPSLQQSERQPSEAEAKQKADEETRKRRKYGAAVAVVVLIAFSVVFWWPKREETQRVEKQEPPNETAVPTQEKKPEGQKETIKQPPVAKLQPQKRITEPTQEKVEARKEVPSQAPAEYKQEKPIVTQPVLSAGKVFRDRLKDGQEGPEMVVIPAGTFSMGDSQGGGNKLEQPVHTVRIQKSFAIGRYEVTFEEYDKFATATGRELPGDKGFGRSRRPVINVSWNNAMDYAEWLSQQTAKRYRLPTEAEWEYAARAGTDTAYWWGNEMKPDMANGFGSNKTLAVGSFQPNPFGLYDTAGNVVEWVQDCWHENYKGAPQDGSAWKEAGGGDCAQRVIRNGSWGGAGPVYLRSSYRHRLYPYIYNDSLGFRLAQDLD